MFFLNSRTRLGAVEASVAKVAHELHDRATWDRGAIEQLQERIEALEKAVEGSKSTIRLLKNEWEDVLDRANRVMGRLNARIRKFEGQNEPVEDAEPGPKGLVPQGSHAALAEARRRRSGVLPG